MLCLACSTAVAQFTFTEKSATPFPRVERSSIAFSDVDGEKGPDVLITGWAGSKRIAKLYLNDGSGNFTEKTMGVDFPGVEYSSIAFADVDGENGPDVLITGINNDFERIAKLYVNDGSGNFTEKTMGVDFEGVQYSSIAFADVNKDGHQDVLITGQNNASERI
ncbi:MAG: VCBS repeat-containing protein, partial [Ekhidna sp.]|nr:VCBS repeat-containing protein [Ekhidna sp.]MBC6425417.1 VCBS repeat-containing protein [Ekhidna sp.]